MMTRYPSTVCMDEIDWGYSGPSISCCDRFNKEILRKCHRYLSNIGDIGFSRVWFKSLLDMTRFTLSECPLAGFDPSKWMSHMSLINVKNWRHSSFKFGEIIETKKKSNDKKLSHDCSQVSGTGYSCIFTQLFPSSCLFSHRQKSFRIYSMHVNGWTMQYCIRLVCKKEAMRHFVIETFYAYNLL